MTSHGASKRTKIDSYWVSLWPVADMPKTTTTTAKELKKVNTS